MVGFWIDDDWVLKEHVLELIPMDGDHSGRNYGKLLFESLKKRGISKKISILSII